MGGRGGRGWGDRRTSPRFLLADPLDELGRQVQEEYRADERDGEDHDDERVNP